jgi:hypothetical protein
VHELDPSHPYRLVGAVAEQALKEEGRGMTARRWKVMREKMDARIEDDHATHAE